MNANTTLRANLVTVTTECVDFLTARQQEEFIFRVPGRKEKVAELVELYESGQVDVIANSGEELQVSDVSSLLKQYLTDSSTKVFSRAQVQNLLKVASKVDQSALKDEKKRPKSAVRFNKSLRLTANGLSQVSSRVLSQVLPLLLAVSENATITKMSSYALAVCFAPVFFLGSLSDSEIQTKLQPAIFLTETIIKQATVLFPQLPDVENDPPANREEDEDPRRYTTFKSMRFMPMPKRFSRRKSFFSLSQRTPSSNKPSEDPFASFTSVSLSSSGTRMSTPAGLSFVPEEAPRSVGVSRSLLHSLEPYRTNQCKVLQERYSTSSGSPRHPSLNSRHRVKKTST